MKKIMMMVAIALAAVAAQAQDQTSRTHNMSFNLDLYDIIVMPYTGTFEGSTTAFASEADYDGSNKVLGTETFTVSSNRLFNVTTQLTALNWTGANGHAYNSSYDVNKNMLSSVIAWSVADPLFPAPVNTWFYGEGQGGTFGVIHPYYAYNTDMHPINHAPYGASRPFTMTWYATPGWNYTGGLYTGNVSVTAMQE